MYDSVRAALERAEFEILIQLNNMRVLWTVFAILKRLSGEVDRDTRLFINFQPAIVVGVRMRDKDIIRMNPGNTVALQHAVID